MSKKAAPVEISISTLYEEGNPTSHFRPIADSTLIYFVFLRYAASGLFISCVDVAGYFFLQQFLESNMAFLLTRSITVVLYFLLMREKVFRVQGNLVIQILLFLLLVTINVSTNIGSLELLKISTYEAQTAIYFWSSAGMLLVNYFVQRYVIFREPTESYG